MIEAKVLCDSCGDDAEPKAGHGMWEIGLKLHSFWRQGTGHAVVLHLCSACGSQAARLLGFCYDTGTVLSIARGEMIDGADVHGPNGGGMEDIAFNGIGGGHNIRWHAQHPDALPAAKMVKEQAPWMRAQGYSEKFVSQNAREIRTETTRRMIANGASDEDLSEYLWGDRDLTGYCGESRKRGIADMRAGRLET